MIVGINEMLNKQNKNSIDYVDWTWNPITGCLHDCSYCYLKRIGKRFNADFMTPNVHENRINDILSPKLKSGSRVLVGSSGDMFGEWVGKEDIQKVLDKCTERIDVEFMFLTKNPKRYGEFSFGDNCWLGTTIDGENKNVSRKRYDILIDLMNTVGNRRFISFEPLLGRIQAGMINGLDWVIIGANSNAGAVQPDNKWIGEIVDEAVRFLIPVWIKNNCKYHPMLKQEPKRKICV